MAISLKQKLQNLNSFVSVSVSNFTGNLYNAQVQVTPTLGSSVGAEVEFKAINNTPTLLEGISKGIGNFCDHIGRNDPYRRALMHLNVRVHTVRMSVIGSSAADNGDSRKITPSAHDYSYTRDINYTENFVKHLDGENKQGKETTVRRCDTDNKSYENHNQIYGVNNPLFYDEKDRGTNDFTSAKKISSTNTNSILYKTKRLFADNRINTIIDRFHTENAPGSGTAAKSKYGLSHGRNLLTRDAEITNGTKSYPVNGYNNPYCRVWTHHYQYDKLWKRIRPFYKLDKDKNPNYIDVQEFHKWTKFKTEDGYGWKNGDIGWELSVLSGNQGLPNITPKFKGGYGLNTHTKQCMFSIENLAWRGFDPYSFENALPWEQRGPNGGRIMWFPPYGISFTETTSAQWNPNTFIGRGEDVYTYVKTERTGTLSFMLVVDHPSILDYISFNGQSGERATDTDVLRFFAGCDSGSSLVSVGGKGENGNNDGSSDGVLSDVAIPTPLTDEYIEKKKEDGGNDDMGDPDPVIPDDDDDDDEDIFDPLVVPPYKAKEEDPNQLNKHKIDPGEKISEVDPARSATISFMVFYPNNYSGAYDDIKNTDVEMHHNDVNPIAYLLGGSNSQMKYNKSNPSASTNIPISLEDPDAWKGNGYEMVKGSGISEAPDDKKSRQTSDAVIIPNKKPWKDYNVNDKWNWDAYSLNRVWFRIDGFYFKNGSSEPVKPVKRKIFVNENDKNETEVKAYRNTFEQKYSGEDYDMMDNTSSMFNSRINDKVIEKFNLIEDDGNKSVVSFAEFAWIMHEKIRATLEYKLDDEFSRRVNDTKGSIQKVVDILQQQRTVTSLSIIGYSNSHGRNNTGVNKLRNILLAEQRGLTIKHWLESLDLINGDTDYSFSFDDSKGVKGGINSDEPKMYRSTRVEISFAAAEKINYTNHDNINVIEGTGGSGNEDEQPDLDTPIELEDYTEYIGKFFSDLKDELENKSSYESAYFDNKHTVGLWRVGTDVNSSNALIYFMRDSDSESDPINEIQVILKDTAIPEDIKSVLRGLGYEVIKEETRVSYYRKPLNDELEYRIKLQVWNDGIDITYIVVEVDDDNYDDDDDDDINDEFIDYSEFLGETFDRIKSSFSTSKYKFSITIDDIMFGVYKRDTEDYYVLFKRDGKNNSNVVNEIEVNLINNEEPKTLKEILSNMYELISSTQYSGIYRKVLNDNSYAEIEYTKHTNGVKLVYTIVETTYSILRSVNSRINSHIMTLSNEEGAEETIPEFITIIDKTFEKAKREIESKGFNVSENNNELSVSGNGIVSAKFTAYCPKKKVIKYGNVILNKDIFNSTNVEKYFSNEYVSIDNTTYIKQYENFYVEIKLSFTSEGTSIEYKRYDNKINLPDLPKYLTTSLKSTKSSIDLLQEYETVYNNEKTELICTDLDKKITFVSNSQNGDVDKINVTLSNISNAKMQEYLILNYAEPANVDPTTDKDYRKSFIENKFILHTTISNVNESEYLITYNLMTNITTISMDNFIDFAVYLDEKHTFNDLKNDLKGFDCSESDTNLTCVNESDGIIKSLDFSTSSTAKKKYVTGLDIILNNIDSDDVLTKLNELYGESVETDGDCIIFKKTTTEGLYNKITYNKATNNISYINVKTLPATISEFPDFNVYMEQKFKDVKSNFSDFNCEERNNTLIVTVNNGVIKTITFTGHKKDGDNRVGEILIVLDTANIDGIKDKLSDYYEDDTEIPSIDSDTSTTVQYRTSYIDDDYYTMVSYDTENNTIIFTVVNKLADLSSKDFPDYTVCINRPSKEVQEFLKNAGFDVSDKGSSIDCVKEGNATMYLYCQNNKDKTIKNIQLQVEKSYSDIKDIFDELYDTIEESTEKIEYSKELTDECNIKIIVNNTENNSSINIEYILMDPLQSITLEDFPDLTEYIGKYLDDTKSRMTLGGYDVKTTGSTGISCTLNSISINFSSSDKKTKEITRITFKNKGIESVKVKEKLSEMYSFESNNGMGEVEYTSDKEMHIKITFGENNDDSWEIIYELLSLYSDMSTDTFPDFTTFIGWSFNDIKEKFSNYKPKKDTASVYCLDINNGVVKDMYYNSSDKVPQIVDNILLKLQTDKTEDMKSRLGDMYTPIDSDDKDFNYRKEYSDDYYIKITYRTETSVINYFKFKNPSLEDYTKYLGMTFEDIQSILDEKDGESNGVVNGDTLNYDKLGISFTQNDEGVVTQIKVNLHNITYNDVMIDLGSMYTGKDSKGDEMSYSKDIDNTHVADITLRNEGDNNAVILYELKIKEKDENKDSNNNNDSENEGNITALESEFVGYDKYQDANGVYYMKDNKKWVLVDGVWMLRELVSTFVNGDEIIIGRGDEKNKLRYDQEYHFFKALEAKDPLVFDKLMDKIKYFDPAFHSMTPEGFNARLTFLSQCMRQGNTVTISDSKEGDITQFTNNLAFGRAPYCVLRLGDFYNQMIVIDNISIQYDPLQWDLNTEGIGMQPLLANVSISFKFIGGGDLGGPVRRLQNAMTFNYYANTRLYDNRADRVKYNWDNKTAGALNYDMNKSESTFHHVDMYKD